LEVNEIDVTELAVRHGDGVVIIDVRQEREFVEARVPGAQLLPLSDLPDLLHELPTSETVYVICRTGARSRAACEFLNEQGYEAVNVAGGTLAWMEAGYEVHSGS
jgi:rhodanese-related sulfurtransferase